MTIREKQLAEITKIINCGQSLTEVETFISEHKIYTRKELDTIINADPNYYRKYISNPNLTATDIYLNIQTDIDDISNTGGKPTNLQNQIYELINKMGL